MVLENGQLKDHMIEVYIIMHYMMKMATEKLCSLCYNGRMGVTQCNLDLGVDLGLIKEITSEKNT